MINPVGSKKFSLNVGTIIQIDGSPYALTQETVVSGFEEPRFPSEFEGPNVELRGVPVTGDWRSHRSRKNTNLQNRHRKARPA